MQKFYKKIWKTSIQLILIGSVFVMIPILLVLFGDRQKGSIILAAICGLIGLTFMIGGLAQATGVKRQLRKYGISEDFLGNDLSSGTVFSHCAIGIRYALSFSGSVARLDDLVWAYTNVLSSRSSTSYSVHVEDTSGKLTVLQAKDRAEMFSIHAEILKRVPYVITEYSEAMRELSNKNHSELVRIAMERKNALNLQNFQTDSSAVPNTAAPLSDPLPSMSQNAELAKIVAQNEQKSQRNQKITFWVILAIFVVTTAGAIYLHPKVDAQNLEGIEPVTVKVVDVVQKSGGFSTSYKVIVSYKGSQYELIGGGYFGSQYNPWIRNGTRGTAYLYNGKIYVDEEKVKSSTLIAKAYYACTFSAYFSFAVTAFLLFRRMGLFKDKN